jgi:hypothetical protein
MDDIKNWLEKNLFPKAKSPGEFNTMHKCPFCLTPQFFNTSTPRPSCSNPSCTQKEVPIAYVKDYAQARPVWVHAVGYKSHGKTVFLTTLIDHIEKIPYIWSGSHIRILNQSSLDYITQHRRRIANGEMPQQTPNNFPIPILIHMKKMPRWKDRCFIMYDTGGENFAQIDATAEKAKFIAHANSSILIISLPDLLISPDQRVNYLFDTYLAALELLETNPNQRDLIITYTKADLIENLPPIIHEYLMDDNLWECVSNLQTLSMSESSTKSYVDTMNFISDKLREYTISKIEAGLPFIASAESRGFTLKFTINTSLGIAPNRENRITAPPHPRRVIDPLLWTFELNN